MNFKKAAFISAAALLLLSAAACGKVEKESSDVALDINTATNAVETTSEGDTAETTTAVAGTTSAVTTKEGETTTKKGYSAKPGESTHTTAAPHNTDTPGDPQEPQNPQDPEPSEPDPQTPQDPDPVVPDPVTPAVEPPTDPPAQNVKFSFDSLQSDAAPYIAGLPVQFTRGGGNGCLSGNYDVVSYRCPEITIDCYVDGGVERIFSVIINDSVCSTPEGITIGSSRAEVEAAYGTGDGDPDSVRYSNGNKELFIDYSGDSVIGIQFYIDV